MHPYRTSAPAPQLAEEQDHMPLAVGVLTFTAAVQLSAARLTPAAFGAGTVLAAGCLVAGIAWFLRRPA
jgi:hypothetical protein